jgi:hypothetical protein
MPVRSEGKDRRCLLLLAYQSDAAHRKLQPSSKILDNVRAISTFNAITRPHRAS